MTAVTTGVTGPNSEGRGNLGSLLSKGASLAALFKPASGSRHSGMRTSGCAGRARAGEAVTRAQHSRQHRKPCPGHLPKGVRACRGSRVARQAGTSPARATNPRTGGRQPKNWAGQRYFLTLSAPEFILDFHSYVSEVVAVVRWFIAPFFLFCSSPSLSSSIHFFSSLPIAAPGAENSRGTEDICYIPCPEPREPSPSFQMSCSVNEAEVQVPVKLMLPEVRVPRLWPGRYFQAHGHPPHRWLEGFSLLPSCRWSGSVVEAEVHAGGLQSTAGQVLQPWSR